MNVYWCSYKLPDILVRF